MYRHIKSGTRKDEYIRAYLSFSFPLYVYNMDKPCMTMYIWYSYGNATIPPTHWIQAASPCRWPIPCENITPVWVP